MLDKVEDVIAKVGDEFQKKPVATTIKGVILLWIIKEVVRWFKSN